MWPRRGRGGRPEEPTGTPPAGDGASAEPVRLGTWLRTARLRRGLSLAEIERDTRINRLYLEALEEEHFDVLPAPVYTRGFLRSYARALGLDPAEAVALLPATLPRPPGLEPPTALRQPGRDAAAFTLPALPRFGLPPFSLADGPGLLRWGAAAAGAIALIAAAIVAPRAFRGDSGAPATPVIPAATAPARATAAATTTAAAGTTPRPGASATVPAFERERAPNLVGVRQELAQQTLQELGVSWVTVEIATGEAPAGQVVGQTPAAGTPLKRGDNMTLVVSRGAPRN